MSNRLATRNGRSIRWCVGEHEGLGDPWQCDPVVATTGRSAEHRRWVVRSRRAHRMRQPTPCRGVQLPSRRTVTWTGAPRRSPERTFGPRVACRRGPRAKPATRRHGGRGRTIGRWRRARRWAPAACHRSAQCVFPRAPSFATRRFFPSSAPFVDGNTVSTSDRQEIRAAFESQARRPEAEADWPTDSLEDFGDRGLFGDGAPAATGESYCNGLCATATESQLARAEASS